MKGPKLVLISVDALSPGPYLTRSSHSPFLSQLRQQGAYAEAAKTIYPSLTYPVHASISTGVKPHRHGIYGNTRFDPARIPVWRNAESQDWYAHSNQIRATTLWQAAKEKNQRVGLLRWPSTIGLDVDWLIPEVFPIYENDPPHWDLLKRHSTPSLILPLEDQPGFIPPKKHSDFDKLVYEKTRELIMNEQIDILVAHFTDYDHQAHEHGSQSAEAHASLKTIDGYLKSILELIDLNQTYVFIFGDHGFADFNKRIQINTIFTKQGWIKADEQKILDWTVIAHTNCSMAPIYVRDSSLTSKVIDVLKDHAQDRYEVLMPADLETLGSFPAAVCAIDANPGYSLGQNLHGDLITTIPKTRGEHGYQPKYKEMDAGLLVLGPEVKPGLNLGTVQLLDIPATVSNLMSLPLDHLDGQVLPLSGLNLP